MGSNDDKRQASKPDAAWGSLGREAPSARARRIKRAQRVNNRAASVMQELHDRENRDATLEPKPKPKKEPGLLARTGSALFGVSSTLFGSRGRQEQENMDERAEQEAESMHRDRLQEDDSKFRLSSHPLAAAFFKPAAAPKVFNKPEGMAGYVETLAEDAAFDDPRELAWLVSLSDKLGNLQLLPDGDNQALLMWTNFKTALQVVEMGDALDTGEPMSARYEGLQSQWNALMPYLDHDENDPAVQNIDDLVGKISSLGNDPSLSNTLTSPSMGG